VPAAIGVTLLYVAMPALAQVGLSVFWNYVVTVVGMFPLLLGAALVAHWLEGRQLTWQQIKLRFRLHPISGREWLWTAGLLVIYVGGPLLLSPTARWLASAIPLPIRKGLPHVLDPRTAKTSIPTEFRGVGLRGSWGIALIYLVILPLDIVGEELWWRGYVLPRQELTHPRWAWLAHGILWTFFHAPLWWNLPSLLPPTLSLSFVAFRLKNTTPVIVVHLFCNVLGFVMIPLGVVGLGARLDRPLGPSWDRLWGHRALSGHRLETGFRG